MRAPGCGSGSPSLWKGKGRGLVDAPGGWLAGAKSKYPHCPAYLHAEAGDLYLAVLVGLTAVLAALAIAGCGLAVTTAGVLGPAYLPYLPHSSATPAQSRLLCGF